jgi:hypothetical protein
MRTDYEDYSQGGPFGEVFSPGRQWEEDSLEEEASREGHGLALVQGTYELTFKKHPRDIYFLGEEGGRPDWS